MTSGYSFQAKDEFVIRDLNKNRYINSISILDGLHVEYCSNNEYTTVFSCSSVQGIISTLLCALEYTEGKTKKDIEYLLKNISVARLTRQPEGYTTTTTNSAIKRAKNDIIAKRCFITAQRAAYIEPFYDKIMSIIAGRLDKDLDITKYNQYDQLPYSEIFINGKVYEVGTKLADAKIIPNWHSVCSERNSIFSFSQEDHNIICLTVDVDKIIVYDQFNKVLENELSIVYDKFFGKPKEQNYELSLFPDDDEIPF